MGTQVQPFDQICAVHLEPYTWSEKKVKAQGTASGVLIDPRRGYVLSHASLIYPLNTHFHESLLRNLRQSGSSNNDNRVFNCKVNLEVIIPNSHLDLNEAVISGERNVHPVSLSNSLEPDSLFTKYKGTVKMVFENKHLREVLLKLMPQEKWTFDAENIEGNGFREDNSSKNDELYYFLLPCFVLIQLKKFKNNGRKSVLTFRDALSNMVGDPVEICATPFGSMNPEVFLNSRSSGIISKVAGPQRVLLMTDARCVPGCEGGGLFYVYKGQRILAGMMLASLCWRNNEWVGLSLACAISELLGTVSNILHVDVLDQKYFSNTSLDQSCLASMVSRVFCLTQGHNWGSAVSLDPHDCVYLTCSHVVRGAKNKVKATNSSTTSDLDIIYMTGAERQFDVALLRKLNVSDTAECVNVGLVSEGEVVYMVGHAIFSNNIDPSPMVTRGVVSKVCRYGKTPVMIQTTCAVHAGASGGGVFNNRGQLVAIVVCNSRDTISGAVYPHVNMCIPVATIMPVIAEYLRTKDVSVLEGLDVKNKVVRQLWSIGTLGDAVHCQL